MNSSREILVYPNPGTGVFYFNRLDGINTIEIYDISGRMISKVISKDDSYSVDLHDKEKDSIYLRSQKIKTLFNPERLLLSKMN